jgi:hypothetical protein
MGRKNPITGAPPNTSAGIINPDRNNFAPRVGIASRPQHPNSNSHWFRDLLRLQHEPDPELYSRIPLSVCGDADRGRTELPIPGPYNLSTNPYAPFSPAIANLSGTVDLNRRDPYAIEYNFGIQQMLTGNLLLEVDYVGTNGQSD